MSHSTKSGDQSYLETVRPERAPSHRSRPLRVLFVHRDPQAIDSCLQELKKGNSLSPMILF